MSPLRPNQKHTKYIRFLLPKSNNNLISMCMPTIETCVRQVGICYIYVITIAGMYYNCKSIYSNRTEKNTHLLCKRMQNVLMGNNAIKKKKVYLTIGCFYMNTFRLLPLLPV